MIKTITIIAVLLLSVAFNSYAHDSDRIDQLEKEVQELKLHISAIESFLSDPSTVQEVVTSNEGWNSVSNWRKLTRDMNVSDIQKILGEPQRVDGGTFTSWYYPNSGSVIFYKGKVDRWMEPRP